MNNNFSKRVQYILPLIALLIMSGLTSAQEITGNIIGVVRDSSGAIVAGATVTITDPSKNNIVVRTVQTNEGGEYSVPNLNPAVYQVTVEAANFKKSVQTDVKVDIGQRRPVDFSLEAGNIAEVVTVEADAVAVETSTPTSSTVINGDQVRELSLNNRNWVQLVTLAPGVTNDLADQVYVGTTNPDGQANTVNISVNGARSSQNTFTVDGADITDRGSNITIQAYPSVDSIGEFRVLRSLYPAESGRSGGGQVNVITRSGTRDLHGSAYMFYRNEAFNANSFLSNAVTTPQFGRDPETGKAKRPPFKYYNYGYTVSGPVFFFNFGERSPEDPFFTRYEKTFFFFSQEFRRDRRFSAPSTVTVPDQNLRNGIFPIDVCINRVGTAETCADASGRLTAGTPLPASYYSPAARAYLNNIYNRLPLPNAATANAPYNLSVSLPGVADFRQEIFKLDHSFSDKLTAFYRFQNDDIPTIDANSLFSSGTGLPNVSTTTTNSPGRTHTAQATYVLSPKTIVEGRYNYSYGAIISQNIGLLSLQNFAAPIRVPFGVQRDRNPTIGNTLSVAAGNGFSGLTSFGPYDNFSNKHNYTASLTSIFGSHTTKYGLSYSRYRKNENAIAGNNEGIFLNAFSNTTAIGVPTTGTQGTINQNVQRFANFLVGNVAANGFTQAAFDYTGDLRQTTFEAYAQDEWRFRSNLTVYYGVRYSYFPTPYDQNGRLSNFDPALFNRAVAPTVTGAGTRVAGTGNFCNGIIVNEQNFSTGPSNFGCTPTVSPYGKYVVDNPKTDFAPRVGIAYDPFGDGRTAIRTGYGIYHEQILSGVFLQNIGTNPPYQINATNPAATTLDNPNVGTSVPAAQSLRAVQTDWKTPYTQHWSLDVQRQLFKNTIVTAGYYGSKGTNLIGVTELNSIRPGTALNSTCTNAAGATVTCQPAGYVFRNTASAPNNPNGTTTDILILDQLRPYRGYRSIAIIQPRYNSNYHSLQLQGTQRFSGASQVNIAYTFSKNLTDAQTDRSSAPQNTYDQKSEYGRASLDRRHVFTTNFVYELPFFRDQNGLVGKLLGGFQASGIINLQTGLPFTAVTSNFDPAGTGLINANPTARPNILCDPNSGGLGTREQFFNTACFQLNPGNTVATTSDNRLGTAQRGIIEGPGTQRFDFTLTKNLRFLESLNLQLKAEVFNIFNKTNFRGLSVNTTATNFGQVTTVRDPRTMQFSAKLNF